MLRTIDIQMAMGLINRRLEPFFRYVAQVSIVRSDKPPEEAIISSGTISMIETPERQFLVTNRHVYDGYMQARKTDKSVRLGLFGTGSAKALDISDLEILGDGGESYDLITLGAAPSDQLKEIGKEYWKSAWPPARATTDDWAIAFGFPTEARRYSENGLIQNRRRKIGSQVTGSGNNQFQISDYESARDYVSEEDLDIPSSELSHGGMSGCAVFLFNHEHLNPRLGGFLHSTSEGKDATLMVHHADLISPDGIINT
ncbi:MAG: hypothetical protein EOP06_31010 [Proteobacteria bacterium]|nr:MAG: hypothetical protein EOP06_31010 [Pseudomonadota bacterium]